MMRLFIIGFIIGIGKILPGVSGSVLAIRFNIYDKVINTISHFFADVKDNILFLFKIALGFIIATILGSKVLYFLFNQYELYLKIIFVILILTGLPELAQKSKSFLSIMLMTIILCILLTSINTFIYNCNINYFIAGIVESLSTIIPGISGTAIYLNLGWYDEILLMFSNFYRFEFIKTIPFLVGFALCSVLLVKIISFFMKNYEKYFYSLICSLMITSLILIFYR